MTLEIEKSGQATQAGGGSDPAFVGGTLSVNTTAVGTSAVTTEEDLMTYSLPANTLLRDGQGVRVKAWGTFGANGNDKTLQLYFGASVITSGVITINNASWEMDLDVFRTGVGTQDILGLLTVGSGITNRQIATKTEDETAAIVIKTTGENGTANANDIVCEGMTVEFLNF